MKLSALLNSIVEVDTDIECSGLCLDSRFVKQGDLFIALNGALQHGLNYVDQAIKNGAIAVIYDPAGFKQPQHKTAGFMAMSIRNLSQQLGEIAARFYQYPSRQLDVIGVTGTNGKTTCSQLIAQALTGCGVIGTLGWGELGQLQTVANTTPDAVAVQKMLFKFVEQKKSAVAMEVSSHGLEQGRVNAVDFKGAVFTNLSRDHLDYHGSMASYLQAKLGLFTNSALKFVVVNLDDPNSPQVLQAVKKDVKRWTFSTSNQTVAGAECLIASNVQHRQDGIFFEVNWAGQTAQASTPIVGTFNLQNVMTVLCVLLAQDWPFAKAVAQLANLKPVVGRMEKFGGQDKPAVIVDYAHTPDALEKVLLSCKGNGQLWVVFGCGGDRDTGKRPQMGRIAESCADHVIVTDDNPRTETAEAIIQDILQGCLTQKVSIINDRALAINTVIQQAAQNDCIVIAGKGHENYQEIKGVKNPFSDQAVVQQALATWKPKA
ncbi:MAG: UDP-N-acetylmuramoyl-L-alanyl-D-glutamate--2,6-diaminopimelate ligase [Methylomonas lenta]|nr:UDP-N-acetylmuramoyl-L-alanyl-D-glutamate--2,6-diaminopimelate ligase [Methylomonas lenta]